MSKHKQDIPYISSDDGRAQITLGPDDIIYISLVGRITDVVITKLLDDLPTLTGRLRQAGKPVYMLIDIGGITGHNSAARVAGKRAARLDFDRGAAYGGTVVQGLVMQYLQRSISVRKARYFRSKAEALNWVNNDSSLPAVATHVYKGDRPVVLLVALLLCLVIGATYISWSNSQEAITKESQAVLDNDIDNAYSGLQNRLQVYIGALYGFRGLYAASNEVNQKEFHSYFTNLNLTTDYPGFNAISYIQRVKANQKNAYLNAVRRDTSLNPKGKPGFKITPDAAKDEYSVITFIEPTSESPSIGLDLSSSSERQQAFELARDSGSLATSTTVKLVGSQNLQGFIMTLPVYQGSVPGSLSQRREQLKGFVNAVFDYEKLFKDSLAFGQKKSIGVSISDAQGKPVFTSGEQDQPLKTSRVLEIGGQKFKLTFAAPRQYGLSSSSDYLPQAEVAGGFATSVLLLILLLIFLRSRHRAIALATVMTEDLEQERNQAIMAQHKLEAAKTELKQEKASVEKKIIERTQELSEIQAQLKASIQSLPFGFAIIDKADQILFANSQLAENLGRPIPADITQTPAVLHQLAEDYQASFNLIKELHQTQTKLKPFEKVVELGSNFYRFDILPITVATDDDHIGASASAIGAVLVMSDITEEKALQRSRDEFFSIASHELRTPLTAIRGNLSMLIDFFGKGIKDPQFEQMVRDSEDASVRLITIVNDFLDMSRLEQGRIDFTTHPVDLKEVASQVIREYKSLAKDQNLELKLDATEESHLALADMNRLHQVISNLMSNALRYTESGNITLRLTSVAGKQRLSVIDTGQGIPGEYQHLLFHKFQQASSSILTRDSTRSTGLGLYISKLIAQGMKGKLYLESSEVGRGSCFTLELPMVPEAKKPVS